MSSSDAEGRGGLAAFARLPRTVVALGVVSLFADLSSEMVYPLLPLFLSSVLGAGALALGLIEGVAESTASLVKLLSGRWSDRLARRKPLVVGGYSLAGLARPLIGLAGSWPAVLLLRFVDRVGKGLRSSPRDALLTDATPSELRGTAFGLHRAMDHAGAVLGPLAAAALLALPGMDLRRLFFWTLVPSLAVVTTLVLAVREKPRSAAELAAASDGARQGSWVPRPVRRLLTAVLVFTLGNSSDAFLLLRLGQAGLGASAIAALWSAHHVVKMAGTALGGRLADRLGRRPLVLAGWGVYVAAYLGFAWAESSWALITIFLFYGLALGSAEPAEKAWVADLAPAEERGAAFGAYHAAVGVAALPASLLFGALWQLAGPSAAFSVGAALALVAALLAWGVAAPSSPSK